MKLIFAQGNPGREYESTRHNVGWQVFLELSKTFDLSWKEKARFQAFIAETTVHGEKILFVQPTTFYNLTGVSARTISDFYHISSADILVLHDDIALPFGSIRIRQGGSPAGNNGVVSLNQHIDDQYWRLRIGIGTELRERMHDADFVLGKFTTSEQTALHTHIIPACHVVVQDFIDGKHASTSQRLLDQSV